jgi:hypothetical protein
MHGLQTGLVLAVLLPLFRLAFVGAWAPPSSWPLAVMDSVTDMVILGGTALLIDRIVRQEEELRILEGLLPICSFCKRIRDEAGDWRQLEAYISSRSPARFSHTFCPDCGRRHYPDLAD